MKQKVDLQSFLLTLDNLQQKQKNIFFSLPWFQLTALKSLFFTSD